MSEKEKCPCGSKERYENCCQPFHLGKNPKSAEELMRSRYCAFVLNLPDYIIETTHPGSPQYTEDLQYWKEQISAFSRAFTFEKLEVIDTKEQDAMATVTFVAHLSQDGQDASFTEKSFFEKVKGRWLYRGGQLAQGHSPNLMTISQVRLLPLAYYGDPILRKKAEPIEKITEDVKQLIEEMYETMEACNGIGLAAPQVHHSIRLFVIRELVETPKGEIELGELRAFINPVISSTSQESWTESEGCLSIPSIHGEVERPKEITLEYVDMEGNRKTEKFSGWLAREIMHETDHLNGVLFIDHLSEEEKKKISPFLEKLRRKIHDGTEL